MRNFPGFSFKMGDVIQIDTTTYSVYKVHGLKITLCGVAHGELMKQTQDTLDKMALAGRINFISPPR